jgi:hypothetical protein
MKILKGLTLPNIFSNLLTTDVSGNIIAATTNDITNLMAVESQLIGGRLSVVSGVGYTTTDQSGGTIYFTPYNGDTIPMYNTVLGGWELQTFSEQSITLSTLSASNSYDIFAVNNNNGTFTLSAIAWTNYTTRAVTLAMQNGIVIKSGSPGTRYLGSIAIDASKVCYDQAAKRWVWNRYNRMIRKIFSADTNAGSYSVVGGSGVWQYCRNVAATSQISLILGQPIEPVIIQSTNFAYIPAGATMATGINSAVYGSPSNSNFVDSGFAVGDSGANMEAGSIMNYTYQSSSPSLYLFTQIEYALGGTVVFAPGASASGPYRSAMVGYIYG